MDLKNKPDDAILHEWYKENIEKEADLKLVLQQYDYELNFKGAQKDLEKLYENVELELEVRHKKRVKKEASQGSGAAASAAPSASRGAKS